MKIEISYGIEIDDAFLKKFFLPVNTYDIESAEQAKNSIFAFLDSLYEQTKDSKEPENITELSKLMDILLYAKEAELLFEDPKFGSELLKRILKFKYETIDSWLLETYFDNSTIWYLFVPEDEGNAEHTRMKAKHARLNILAFLGKLSTEIKDKKADPAKYEEIKKILKLISNEEAMLLFEDEEFSSNLIEKLLEIKDQKGSHSWLHFIEKNLIFIPTDSKYAEVARNNILNLLEKMPKKGKAIGEIIELFGYMNKIEPAQILFSDLSFGIKFLSKILNVKSKELNDELIEDIVFMINEFSGTSFEKIIMELEKEGVDTKEDIDIVREKMKELDELVVEVDTSRLAKLMSNFLGREGSGINSDGNHDGPGDD